MDSLTLARPHPYTAPAYARALAHCGRPVEVKAWRTFVLGRPLPAGLSGEDAMGAYPLAVIDPAADIEAGLHALAAVGLVTVVLVPDPLAGPPPARLAQAFTLCRPFKTHQLVRPARGYEPSKHHRDRVRRGQRRCRIERVRLANHLETWGNLYAGLVDRRTIRGAADFTPAYFAALAGEPAITAFAAFVDERIVAMTLWFEHDGVAYNHLTASDAVGYANGANFALYGAAIDHFIGAEVINLGGGAGFADDPEDGLAAFKRGFANDSVQALLCGAVLDERRYGELALGRGAGGFFPAYRG